MADSGAVPPVPHVSATPAAVSNARAVVAVRFIAAVLALALLVAGGLLLAEILDDNASLDDMRWFGHVAALTGLLIISAMVAVVHRAAVRRQVAAQPTGKPAAAGAAATSTDAVSIPGILIGADNRLSTSKLAAFAWTWALAWAILSLFIADWVGAAAGWTALVDQGLQDEYLVLLGGPFVALVSAKALVATDVQSGTQVKTSATEEQTALERVAQAFSDDNGQTDLVDTQYLLFGSLAIVVFVVAFLRDPGAGLPDLPDFIVGLTGVGATAYIANKVAARDAPPHVDRVVPDHATPGSEVTVFGRNLLTVSQGGRRAPAEDPVRVFIGALAVVRVDPRRPDAHTTASGSDYFTFTVPPRDRFSLPAGEVAAPVSVQNAIGVMSDNAAPFTLVLG
jgi:hypothetical protein